MLTALIYLDFFVYSNITFKANKPWIFMSLSGYITKYILRLKNNSLLIYKLLFFI